MIFKLNFINFILFNFFLTYICRSIKLHDRNKLTKNNFMSISNIPIKTIRNKNNSKENDTRKYKIMINYYNKSNIFQKSFFLSVSEDTNIKDLKKKIETLHGIPTEFQEVLYENKSLSDHLIIKNLIEDKKIKLLNFRLIPILPHIFNEETNDEHEKENKKIKNLKDKLKYFGYITMLNEYKKLLKKLEEKKYIIKGVDIIESFNSFDKEFEKILKNNNINLEKIKKEIDDLKFVDKKKLLLRLQVDYPLMSNLLLDRIKQLIQFYYLGDVKSVIKFSIFFYILYKYANYPRNIKTFFLYLSIFTLIAPCKYFYKIMHFLFFFVPQDILFSGFTNVLSAPYQQILMCQ
ncbi:ubiquitin, putative [Plasmodium gallinaceum]|uniref:Ubiquitin, putative n=1 Tax=Plasmodium gallinaceum TaxID=5849 RepID=A0A1J1GLC3_PLAGA|nr:ubiquitin, putative [Plasmodium gallinaceum]CRG93161.1 ubiquitin, putative [Plasmodium gallinaceum]